MPDGIPTWLRSVLKKSTPPTSTSQDAAVADAPQVEPFSLARRIRFLIYKYNGEENDHQELSSASFNDDQQLLQALSSPVLMNGSLDGRRTSVWRALEEMDSRTSSELPHNDTVSEPFNEPSSVMVYSPLIPVQGSLVELAQSEVIIEQEEGQDQVHARELETTSVPPFIPALSWTNSLRSWFTKPSQPTPPPPAESSMTPRTREQHLRAQRAWVPSKDKLSIQCMWWGYRMCVWCLDCILKHSCFFWRFLPPPVLDILDDKQLEAVRRAAIITTALTWFFNNLPINTLPIALRPTLLLVQHIAPFLGSIGTFISWSWNMIKAYDQGYGITLTATWLLPIALIPGTWFQRDWPVSPPSLDLAPLPSIESILQSSAGEFQNHTTLAPHFMLTPRQEHCDFFPSPQSIPQALGHVGTPSLPDSSIYRSSCEPTCHYPGSPPLETSSPLPSGHSHLVSSSTSLGDYLSSLTGAPSPLPDLSYIVHLSPPTSPLVSSPFLSPETPFTTAPSSPVPPSPKRFAPQSPDICVREKKHAVFSPKMSSSVLAGSSIQCDKYFAPYVAQMTSPPLDTSVVTPVVQHLLDPTLTHSYPSPPADPNDIQLLQSPLWQCSPLPPEQNSHE